MYANLSIMSSKKALGGKNEGPNFGNFFACTAHVRMKED